MDFLLLLLVCCPTPAYVAPAPSHDIWVVQTVADETRVDLYDTKGQRKGHVRVDEKTGRVDTYDKDSKRTGWGTVSPSGQLDLYDTKGKRVEPGRGFPSQGRK